MLTEVKNQLRISFLSVKYAIQREMLNKMTFISNVVFMILNNFCFIIQWLILYSLKSEVGGYSLKQVYLLWGLAAGTYGVARFFFIDAFNLPTIINSGKLDVYLIQPKNVLLSCITSSVEVSALGDLIYGFIMLLIYGFSIQNLLLFMIFIVCGGLILVSISIIFSSLSFWFGKVDIIANNVNSMMTNFATYPEGIFKGVVKIMFYTILPIGFVNYLPVKILTDFNFFYLLIVILVAILLLIIAFIVFYKGLRKYSSSNLMNVRM